MSAPFDRPLLSLVTSSYRAAEELKLSAKALFLQADSRLQWVVVDGASNDGTAEYLQSLNQPWISWISEPDLGIYDAWNKALKLAQGEWICFVGAGDIVLSLPEMLRIANEASATKSIVRLQYGPVEIRNGNGETLYALGQPWEDIKPLMTQVMRIPHPGLMHHRSLFDECGGFDSSFRIAGDYEFLLRCLPKTEAQFHPGAPWVAMYLGGVSTNPGHSVRQLHEVRRAQVQNGIHRPGPEWTAALWRVRVRLLLSKLLPDRWARALLDWGRKLQGKPAHWTRS